MSPSASSKHVVGLLILAVLAFSLLPASASPVQASVPSTGFFYILTGVSGAVCEDAGGGLHRASIASVPRTAYVPASNSINLSLSNVASYFGTTTFSIPAQGAPGSGTLSSIAGGVSSAGSGNVTMSITATLTANGSVVGSSTVTVSCSAAGATPVISLNDTYGDPPVAGATPRFEGPAIPDTFVLRAITCDMPVLNTPAGIQVGDNLVKAGQTFFVNPVPVEIDGVSYTELFASSRINGYVLTACVN